MEGIEESSIKIPEADLKRLREKEARKQQRQGKRKSNSHRSYSSKSGSHRGFNYYADMSMDVGPSPEIEK